MSRMLILSPTDGRAARDEIHAPLGTSVLPAVEPVREGGRDGAADCGQEEQEQRRGGAGEREQRYRVLVADDDEGIRQELERLLSEDYDLVGTVENGRELVDVARELKPDLVIVDISMPKLNGFDAVRQMRSNGVESKVIFFTTNGDPAYVRKAFNLGASGYVLKALGIEELPVAVRMVLSGGAFISPALGMDI